MTKKLTLYHYNKVKIKNRIDPKHFGVNGYTRADKRACGLGRAFYYTQGQYIPEYYIRGWNYKYIVKIDKSSIYDLRIDKLGLINRFKGNISDLLYHIKKHYKGAIYNLGNYDICILFKAVKYNQIINRG